MFICLGEEGVWIQFSSRTNCNGSRKTKLTWRVILGPHGWALGCSFKALHPSPSFTGSPVIFHGRSLTCMLLGPHLKSGCKILNSLLNLKSGMTCWMLETESTPNPLTEPKINMGCSSHSVQAHSWKMLYLTRITWICICW